MSYKNIILFSCFIAGFFLIVNACKINQNRTEKVPTKDYFDAQNIVLQEKLTQLDTAIKQKKSVQDLQNHFKEARLAYKKVEPIVEYFFQGLNKRINGPALPDLKLDDNQVLPPQGFQVIEQYLYSAYYDSLAPKVLNEIAALKTDLNFIKSGLSVTTISPKYFAEMIQHQIIRVGTFGITGADAPLSKLSLWEAISALEGVQTLLKINNIACNNQEFEAAISYLKANSDFDTFDRMTFLQTFLMPLSETVQTQVFKTVINDSIPRPYKGSLKAILTENKFNPDFFTAYDISKSNPAKVELGKLLFYEKGLSKGNKISCGSCHKAELYFTDGLTKANDFIHGDKLARNTPTILYASLQNNQFYDMRSTYLEDQVNEVMKNTSEFNFTSAGIAARILKNDTYKNLFSKAFPKADSVTGFEVRNVLSAYIRSLNPFSSRFDDYMRGDKNAMNVAEIQGFNLFMGKAKCATCHFMPIFNGTIPPWYSKSESEIIGVPATAIWKKAKIDRDIGRYALNQLEELRFSFKTPTVRNAEKTAPYMHNGVYKTLDEVVEFYHQGGGVGLGIDLPFQSLPFDSLVLDKTEKQAIVSFIKSLTDKKDKIIQ